LASKQGLSILLRWAPRQLPIRRGQVRVGPSASSPFRHRNTSPLSRISHRIGGRGSAAPMASPPQPEPAPAEAGLESMEGLVLDTVISRAGARPAAALACASTRLRTAVADDSLWRRFCAEDLGLDAPVDPEGQPLPSFQVRDARPRSFVFFFYFPPLSRFELTEERAAHLRESIVDSSSVMVLVNCFCSLCLEYRMIRIFFLSCIVATEFNFRI
jgi:hypothetical protein